MFPWKSYLPSTPSYLHTYPLYLAKTTCLRACNLGEIESQGNAENERDPKSSGEFLDLKKFVSNPYEVGTDAALQPHAKDTLVTYE